MTWYVKKRVPADLRKTLNKSVIVISTGKRDLREAISERNKTLGDIEKMFDQARNPRDSRLESYRKTAEWLRDEQLNTDWRQEVSPGELADMELERLFYKFNQGRYDIPSEYETELLALRRLVDNPDTNILKETIEQYINQKKGTIRESTLKDKQCHLEQFSEWIGPHTVLTDISARDAGVYLTQKVMKQTTKTGEPISVATMKKRLNIFKAFFSWVESMGIIEKNPFNKTADKLPKKTTGASVTKVKGWTEDELIKLLKAIKEKRNHKLTAITLLAMFTGARGNELAELRTSDVTNWSLKIQGDTKNPNSQRNLPIHSLVRPLVDNLVKTSRDGYLVSGLPRGGEDNKRFHYMSKRFSSMKDKLGFPKRSKVFHSFRHTLVTLLHNAGETTDRIAGVVGHTDDANFTLNTYSDGLESAEAIKVIEKLDYAKKVNQLVAELIEITSN